MSKPRKAGARRDRQRPHGVHLAIDRSRAQRRWGATRRLGQFLILLVFATVVAGLVFARMRMPGSSQFSAHEDGVRYLPSSNVRFGANQPANGNGDAFGEVVDPDITEVPPPAAKGDGGGGQAGAVAE
jgi:hypothetical protein